MSLTFRNLHGPRHYFLQYLGAVDRVEIICFATPHYMVHHVKIQNYADFLGFN
jgi:hypothetical protein